MRSIDRTRFGFGSPRGTLGAGHGPIVSQVAGAVVALVLVVAAACDASASRKRGVIVELLADRATALEPAERRRLARALLRAEHEHGVDALLSLAVVEQESRFDAAARGRRGGLGLMQVQPATARTVAERVGLRWSGPDDLLDPTTNVRIGVAYLAELREGFDDWEATLTAYNAGPRRAKRIAARGRRLSSAYARQVLARYEEMVQVAGQATAR